MASFHFQIIERPGELPLWRLQSADPTVYIDVLANNRAGFIEFVLVWGSRRILFTATEAVEGRPPSRKRDVFWTVLDAGIFGRGVEPYYFQSRNELTQALDFIRAGLGVHHGFRPDHKFNLEVTVRSVILAPTLERYAQVFETTSGGER